MLENLTYFGSVGVLQLITWGWGVTHCKYVYLLVLGINCLHTFPGPCDVKLKVREYKSYRDHEVPKSNTYNDRTEVSHWSGRRRYVVHERMAVLLNSFNLGTNTDGVIIDTTLMQDTTRGILASFKHETTADVTTGIERVVSQVLKKSGIGPANPDIMGLTIGTTVRAYVGTNV